MSIVVGLLIVEIAVLVQVFVHRVLVWNLDLTDWLLLVAWLTVVSNSFFLIVKHLVASERSSRFAISLLPFIELELIRRLMGILLFIISKLRSILSEAGTQIALIIVEHFLLLLTQALLILLSKYIDQVLFQWTHIILSVHSSPFILDLTGVTLKSLVFSIATALSLHIHLMPMD